jgi:predicted GIY-YIG superfamily endonuclease
MERMVFWVCILAGPEVPGRERSLNVGITASPIALWTASRRNHRQLVYAEPFPTALDAIRRELQLKRLSRARKVEIVEAVNPEWRDWFSLRL